MREHGASGGTAASSRRGRRARQEDAWLIKRLPGSRGDYCLAVADGMGGHEAGNLASRLVIDALDEEIEARGEKDTAQAILRRAASRANASILALRDSNGRQLDAGSTLVAAIVSDGRLVIGHVGDSRAYLVEEDRVQQLTVDHTAGAGVVEDAEESVGTPAARAQYAGALLRYLGSSEFDGLDFLPEEGSLRIEKPAIVLLTSDGIHGELAEADILAHLTGTEDLSDGIDGLLRLAYHGGGRDNMTAVALEVGRVSRSARAVTPPPPWPREKEGKVGPLFLRTLVVAAVAGLCLGGLIYLTSRLVGGAEQWSAATPRLASAAALQSAPSLPPPPFPSRPSLAEVEVHTPARAAEPVESPGTPSDDGCWLILENVPPGLRIRGVLGEHEFTESLKTGYNEMHLPPGSLRFVLVSRNGTRIGQPVEIDTDMAGQHLVYDIGDWRPAATPRRHSRARRPVVPAPAPAPKAPKTLKTPKTESEGAAAPPKVEAEAVSPPRVEASDPPKPAAEIPAASEKTIEPEAPEPDPIRRDRARRTRRWKGPLQGLSKTRRHERKQDEQKDKSPKAAKSKKEVSPGTDHTDPPARTPREEGGGDEGSDSGRLG